MGNAAINLEVELTPINCGECGATYAINERYRRQREEKSGFWHCPYCQTSWGYAGGENARLKKELAEEKARKERALAEANNLRSVVDLERKKAARLKKRVAAGVCPCCHRTVSQMARHMKTKHPDYAHTSEVSK